MQNNKGHNHGDRADLSIEHPKGDLGQLIFLLLFMAIWIIDSFILRFSTWLVKLVPLYIHIPLAIIIAITSIYLFKSGLSIVFGEIRDPPSVIKKGPFLRVRHPVYLGEILLYLSLSISTLSVFSFISIIPIGIFINIISAFEEVALVEKFGDEYREYMKKVPRWLIRLKPASFD
jgi:protein-S-isoprenylcysteine O-methyltransferase Ste14